MTNSHRIIIHPLVTTYVFLISFFVPFHQHGNAGQTEFSDDTNAGAGKLIVFPEIPANYDSEISPYSYVYVFSGSKLVATKGTKFRKPVTFEKLRPGKYTILIRPCIYMNDKFSPREGFSGKDTVEITAEKAVEKRIAMKMSKYLPLKVQVIDTNGKILPLHRVTIFDVSEKYVKGRIEHTTDHRGTVEIRTYPSYRHKLLVIKGDKHGAIRYYSDAFGLADNKGGNAFKWNMKEPNRLTITFTTEDKKLASLLDDIKGVYVTPVVGDKAGEGFPKGVKDRRIVLVLNHPWLREADAVALRFNDGLLTRRMELKTNTVKIDGSADQTAEIQLVPPRVCRVTFRAADKDARCYIARDLNSSAIQLKNGEGRELRFGTYRVYYWSPGRELVKSTLNIEKRDGQTLECTLKSGQTFKYKVVGKSGAPVRNARADFRYNQVPNGPCVTARTNASGCFEIVAGGAEGVCGVVSKELGGVLVRKADLDKTNIVRFDDPCTVTGQIIASQGMIDNVFGRELNRRCWIFAFDQSCNFMQLARTRIKEDLSFEINLQPGKYNLMLYAVGCISLGSCTVQPGRKELKGLQFIVTEKNWEDARTAETPPLYFSD